MFSDEIDEYYDPSFDSSGESDSDTGYENDMNDGYLYTDFGSTSIASTASENKAAVTNAGSSTQGTKINYKTNIRAVQSYSHMSRSPKQTRAVPYDLRLKNKNA